MGVMISIILLFFETISIQSLSLLPFNTDACLNINELAEKHGYVLETHEVDTEDGYILSVHRLPARKNIIKRPVFMMHGLFDSSVDWINSGPGYSLAYMLVDNGYDVWMGNARGNAESRRHKTLDPDINKEAFWDFSWHEIGYYDLPAMIDYVLLKTNETQLQYVGYSQGTTTFFVMASTRPEYNNKIKFASLLAPAAELTHLKNPIIKLGLPWQSLGYRFLKYLGIYELFPRSRSVERLIFFLCINGTPTQEICKQIIFLITGKDRDQLDGSFISVMTSNTPAGSSLKQVIHFAQTFSGPFRQFDYYSKEENLEKYGSPEPPKYELRKITAPVAMYYGRNDLLVSTTDAELTATELPNVVHLKQINYSQWTHSDFLWAKDLAEILNQEVLKIMNMFNK